jgi:hypothetical protein
LDAPEQVVTEQAHRATHPQLDVSTYHLAVEIADSYALASTALAAPCGVAHPCGHQPAASSRLAWHADHGTGEPFNYRFQVQPASADQRLREPMQVMSAPLRPEPMSLLLGRSGRRGKDVERHGPYGVAAEAPARK